MSNPKVLVAHREVSPEVADDEVVNVGAGIVGAGSVLTIGTADQTVEIPGTVTLPTSGGLAAEFEIDGVAVSTDVTANNLSELTGGGETALHSHAGVPAEFEIDGVATSANVTAANLNAVTDGSFAGMIQKRTVTIGVSGSGAQVELTTIGLSQVVNLGAVLPANAMVLGVDLALTSFSGGGAAAVLADVGTSGDDDAIVANANLFAAAVDGKASDMPDGIAPHKLFVSAGAQLTITITGDVNVSTLTAGQVKATIAFVALP